MAARLRSANSRPSNMLRIFRSCGGGIAFPRLPCRPTSKRDALPETVVNELTPKIDALRKDLPAAYSITVGGTVEESQKSQASVIAVIPLMLLIMLTVLMIELQSFQRLGLVLSVAPLGLIGVVAALLVSGRPLGSLQF